MLSSRVTFGYLPLRRRRVNGKEPNIFIRVGTYFICSKAAISWSLCRQGLILATGFTKSRFTLIQSNLLKIIDSDAVHQNCVRFCNTNWLF